MSASPICSQAPIKVSVQGAISVLREVVRLNKVSATHAGNNRIQITQNGLMLLESTGFKRSILNGGERWLAFLILKSDGYALYPDDFDSLFLKEGDIILVDSHCPLSMKNMARSSKSKTMMCAMLVKAYARKPSQAAIEKHLLKISA